MGRGEEVRFGEETSKFEVLRNEGGRVLGEGFGGLGGGGGGGCVGGGGGSGGGVVNDFGGLNAKMLEPLGYGVRRLV